MPTKRIPRPSKFKYENATKKRQQLKRIRSTAEQHTNITEHQVTDVENDLLVTELKQEELEITATDSDIEYLWDADAKNDTDTAEEFDETTMNNIEAVLLADGRNFGN